MTTFVRGRGKRNPVNDRVIEAAARQYEAEGRVTSDHVAAVLGLSRGDAAKRASRMREQGRFPWSIAREVRPSGARPPRVEPQKVAVYDPAAPDEELMASARRQMRRGRWVDFAVLMADSGLKADEVRARIGVMRVRGLWPYKVVGLKAREKRVAEPVGQDCAADAVGELERRRAIFADAIKGMGDGRGEVDDPRTHGLLAVPRSLPAVAKQEASEIGRWVAEARRVRRRLGIGAKGKARRRAA